MRRGRLHLLPVVALAVITACLVASVRAQTTTPAPPQTWDAFFDDTVLHEIRLVINSRDWQSLQVNYLDNTYYPADVKWNTSATVRNIGIRSRGTGSRSGVKPGLRVDFNRYVTDQTFMGLTSFILRNQTQDASNIHERLSMLLFKRLGLPAPREAHAKLYINNLYSGLYTLVESVDKNFLKENLNENDGYLYKFDYPTDAKPYYFEDRGSDPTTYVPLPFKPETHETDPRPEFVVQLVQAINQSSDAVFPTAIAQFLDLKKFVRHLAVENYVVDNDGFVGDYGMNNFYFYQLVNKTLFQFIAWDKSEAFKSGFEYSIFHNITGVPDNLKNRLVTRALALPDIYSAYLDALADCVKSATEKDPATPDGATWMEREIQKEYTQIRDAALADPNKTFSNDQFEQAINDLMIFARHRADSVTSQVAAARPR